MRFPVLCCRRQCSGWLITILMIFLSTVSSDDYCNVSSFWPAHCQLVELILGGSMYSGNMDYKVKLPHHLSKDIYTLSLWRIDSLTEHQCICNCKSISKTCINKSHVYQQNDARQEVDCQSGCYQFALDEDDTIKSCCFYILNADVFEDTEGNKTIGSNMGSIPMLSFPHSAAWVAQIIVPVGMILILLYICLYLWRLQKRPEKVHSILLMHTCDSKQFCEAMKILGGILRSTLDCVVHDPHDKDNLTAINKEGMRWILQKVDESSKQGSKIVVVESETALLLQSGGSYREQNSLNDTLQYFFNCCLPKLTAESRQQLLHVRLKGAAQNKPSSISRVLRFIPSLITADKITLPHQLSKLLQNLGWSGNAVGDQCKRILEDAISSILTADDKPNPESLISVSSTM